MFKIDPAANRINPLEVKRFSDLGFTERKHLQEWLENYPQALTQGDGDELLIIQKEFDGFDDTRERLDLLAIDKDGNLVIIENKLDDSGRDVVWQALKYASYCANLKKQQVVEIFQRYLNQKAQNTGSEPDNAERVLLEFLQADDLQSVQLNTLKSQRLILVGELEEDRTAEDFSVVRQEGNRQVRRRIKHYNLDAIISMGYPGRPRLRAGGNAPL